MEDMKQKSEWTDALRNRMKGAQMEPPAGGWARLEKELGATGMRRERAVPWKRVATWTAAVAAVLAVVFFAVPDKGVQEFRSSDDSNSKGVAFRLSDFFFRLQTDRLQTSDECSADESVAGLLSVSLKSVSLKSKKDSLKSEVCQSKKDSLGVCKSDSLSATPPGNPATPASSPFRPDHWLADAAQSSPGSGRGKSRGRITLGIPGGGTGGGTTSVMPGALALMNGNYYYSSRPMAAPPAKGPSFASNPYATIGNYVFNHRPELSVGLSISYEPIERLVLETGLVWTTLSSQVITPANTREQRVQYLGLPLYAGWRFAGRGALSLTLSAGTTVERCLGARLGTWRQDERPWQFAVGGQMTVGYGLGHHVSLAFQPGLSYHLTETRLTTSRTGHPWAPSFRLTLQYTL